jgi:hypothetical protein
MAIDWSKLGDAIAKGNEPMTVKCEMCGHRWEMSTRDALAMGGTIGNCPKCDAGRWEGQGSKMLDALLNLEEGLSERELEFVEGMAQRRLRCRRQGFKDEGWPSAKQVAWLKQIYERLC